MDKAVYALIYRGYEGADLVGIYVSQEVAEKNKAFYKERYRCPSHHLSIEEHLPQGEEDF